MADVRDLDLDDIIEWPYWAQWIAMIVLVLLIQGLGTWFYLIPQEEELQRLNLQESSLMSTYRIKANKVAALPQLESDLDELTTRYGYLLEQLPVQKELASMLAAVNEVGLKNDLTFTRIDWGDKQEQEFLNHLPLNIELTGSYANIGEFAEAIAKLPRIITLNDIDWQRVSQESSTLHFRVRASTYQFKQGVVDAP